MEAVTEAVEAGKARHIGFSEWTRSRSRRARCEGVAKFVSSQPQYNTIWRAPEAEVFPVTREDGIRHIVWSPLAQGVLTGKYEPGHEHPERSRATSDEMGWAMERYMSDEVLAAVQRLGRSPRG